MASERGKKRATIRHPDETPADDTGLPAGQQTGTEPTSAAEHPEQLRAKGGKG